MEPKLIDIRKNVSLINDTLNVTILEGTASPSNPPDTTVPSGTPTLSGLTKKIVAQGSTGLGWKGRAALKVINGITVLCYLDGAHTVRRNSVLRIRFSNDYGQTWTDEDTYLDGSSVTNFPMRPEGLPSPYGPIEPWIYVTETNKLILHHWAVSDNGSPTQPSKGTWQSVSTDFGKTWTKSSQITIQDNPWPDFRSFATDDDFYLNGLDGTIYTSYRYYKEFGGEANNNFMKTEDYGETWQFISKISTEKADGFHETGIEYVGNNNIVTLNRALDNEETALITSSNFGATFPNETNITGSSGLTSRHRIYTRSHLKKTNNWWDDPVLIAACFEHPNPGKSHPRINSILISKDSGNTWPYLLALDSSDYDGGYGDIIYDPLRDEYVCVSYKGPSFFDADIVQYNFKIVWK